MGYQHRRVNHSQGVYVDGDVQQTRWKASGVNQERDSRRLSQREREVFAAVFERVSFRTIGGKVSADEICSMHLSDVPACGTWCLPPSCRSVVLAVTLPWGFRGLCRFVRSLTDCRALFSRSSSGFLRHISSFGRVHYLERTVAAVSVTLRPCVGRSRSWLSGAFQQGCLHPYSASVTKLSRSHSALVTVGR